MTVSSEAAARRGDHARWISDVGRFRADYPGWSAQYDLGAILADVRDGMLRSRDAR
jgi:hypothetical protein